MVSPVAGATGEKEWSRRNQSGIVDGAVVEVEERGVLADTTTLVVAGEHYRRGCDLDAVVEGGEEVGLRCTTRFAGAADASSVDVFAGEQVVEHFDAVVGLKTEHTQPEKIADVLVLPAQERAVLQLHHVVGQTDHRPGEGSEPVKGVVHRPMGDGTVSEWLGPRMHPVAVGMEDEWELPFRILRAVEVAHHIESGQRLDSDVLDDDPFVFEGIDYASLRSEGGRSIVHTCREP